MINLKIILAQVMLVELNISIMSGKNALEHMKIIFKLNLKILFQKQIIQKNQLKSITPLKIIGMKVT